MDFDSLIIADWPRGLYLVKQLNAKGKKTAYLEITPYLKKPFPLFLDESKEKNFLENLGFLSFQEEGFCFLSPEGVRFFKQKDQNKTQEDLKFKTSFLKKSFLKDNLFSYLGQNLAGRVFDFNDSCFSRDSLSLFSDCFLFEPSFRKKEEFKKDHSKIYFFSKKLEDLIKKKSQALGEEGFNLIKNQLEDLGVSAKNIFCFSDRVMQLAFSNRTMFQWQAVFFDADLGGYESVVPNHFLGIKQLLFPWCYDNLMSVFQKKGILEVWMRLPLDRDTGKESPKISDNKACKNNSNSHGDKNYPTLFKGQETVNPENQSQFKGDSKDQTVIYDTANQTKMNLPKKEEKDSFKKSPKNHREFVKKAQENLESFFPGAKLQLKEQAPLESFYVYEKEILNTSISPFTYMQNCQDFFQASLAYDIKKEIQLSQNWIEQE